MIKVPAAEVKAYDFRKVCPGIHARMIISS